MKWVKINSPPKHQHKTMQFMIEKKTENDQSAIFHLEVIVPLNWPFGQKQRSF